MAEELGYFVDPSGETVQIPLEQSVQARQAGYLPASDEQAKDFDRTKKLSAPLEQAKTFAEGLGQTLTFGASTGVERLFGTKPEDIKGREEVNPGWHLTGALTGVAAPIAATLLTGGAAAPGLAAEGAGITGAIRSAAGLSAPSLIAKAGEHVAELLPEAAEAASGLGRVGLRVARGAASAGTEGALYGAGHVVHEAALGDPNLTVQNAMEEIGLSGLVGGAVGGSVGLLGGLVREAAGSDVAQKLSDWAQTAEGNQNIKQAGGGKAAFRWLFKKMSPAEASKVGQEAGDMGLVSTFSRPADTLERSAAMMEEIGPKIDQGIDAVDASASVEHPSAAKVMSKVREEVLEPLKQNPLEKSLASKVGGIVEDYEKKLGAENPASKVTLRQLSDIRREINKSIYGLTGNLTVSTTEKEALRELSNVFGDELKAGLEKSGAGAEIKALNRQYSVAATINHIAEVGMAGQMGNMPIPLTAMMGAATGLLHGGPLGAATLGLGALAAKKYGPGVLAAGARGLRNFIDDAGAESVISKTADMIAGERRAATGLVAEGSSKIAMAFDRAAEAANPMMLPAKDAARDQLQEQLAASHKIEHSATSAPESVAALSHLAAANKRVSDRVSGLAGSLVAGKSVSTPSSASISADEHTKYLERIYQMASNPELLQQHITDATRDLQGHAPGVAQAYAIQAARTVNYLNQKFPPKPKIAPLAPDMKPNHSDAFRLKETKSVLAKPSALLKHAANGTLTSLHMDAVASVFPEMLHQMQQAVLEKAAESTKPIPYKSRLMMSVLLGKDMDGTASSGAIAAAQAVYNMPSAKSQDNQTGPGAMKSTQTGLAKLNIASRSSTPGQSSESRRREV